MLHLSIFQKKSDKGEALMLFFQKLLYANK